MNSKCNERVKRKRPNPIDGYLFSQVISLVHWNKSVHLFLHTSTFHWIWMCFIVKFLHTYGKWVGKAIFTNSFTNYSHCQIDMIWKEYFQHRPVWRPFMKLYCKWFIHVFILCSVCSSVDASTMFSYSSSFSSVIHFVSKERKRQSSFSMFVSSRITTRKIYKTSFLNLSSIVSCGIQVCLSDFYQQ